MNWLLNIIGISIFFIGKYVNRKHKTITSTWEFWWKDNWPEFVQTFLFNLALMIILQMKQVTVNVDKFLNEGLPFDISVDAEAGKAIVSFLVGLIITSLIYRMYKAKEKSAVNRK